MLESNNLPVNQRVSLRPIPRVFISAAHSSCFLGFPFSPWCFLFSLLKGQIRLPNPHRSECCQSAQAVRNDLGGGLELSM